MDGRGQAFTIDVMLALILLTVIIGISADAMDITGNKLYDYSTETSLNRIANNIADILINTPGHLKTGKILSIVPISLQD